jgi:DNA-binding GntR family transcriptional regulator
MTHIVRDRVSSQVHRYLRDKIVQGEYSEGTRLVEVDVASELGVSRTPVREALWQLRSMDLVRQAGTGGYEVTDVRRELANILEIRAALEAHAVRRAVERISEAELGELAQVCARMERLPFARSEDRAALNREFHEALVRAAGNERLLRMVTDYQSYFVVAQPLFDAPFIRRTQREHREIVDSLAARDADRASRLVTEHVLGAAEFLTRKYESQGKPKVRSASRNRRTG